MNLKKNAKTPAEFRECHDFQKSKCNENAFDRTKLLVQGCVILFIQHKESGLSLLRSELEHQFNDLKVTLRADHMYRSGIVDLLRVQAPSVSGISKKR